VSRVGVLSWSIRLLTAAGLGVDAVVHVVLAPTRPPAAPGQWSQAGLFYAEAAVAVVVAVLLLATGARVVHLVAVLVAASAVVAVLVSRYVDTGPLGPIPDLYEPFWYTSKVVATVAEAVAAMTAAAGVLLGRHHAVAHRGQAATP
jgi:hypothetical protein